MLVLLNDLSKSLKIDIASASTDVVADNDDVLNCEDNSDEDDDIFDCIDALCFIVNFYARFQSILPPFL